LVDILSIRTANPMKRWGYKSDYEIKMIEERYGVIPNYDFINFQTALELGYWIKEHHFLFSKIILLKI